MNNNPVVSVVIPAYNVEHYIGSTFDSILGQSYTRVEIIVVNDGSTDNTQDILRKYTANGKNIKVVNQPNKGLSSARNTGLAIATGEYICIFDADDIMLPRKIEEQVAFLEKHAEYDIVFSNAYHFHDNTEKIYFRSLPNFSENTYNELLLHENYINPNTVLFRKSMYEKLGGFDEALRRTEDWDYWLRLAYQGVRFGYMPELFTLYRIRKASLNTDYVAVAQAALTVLEKQKSLPQSDDRLSIIKSKISKLHRKLMLGYILKGDWLGAHEVAKHNLVLRALYTFCRCLSPDTLYNCFRFIQKIRSLFNFKRVSYNESKNISSFFTLIR